jgi:hypothetical protein
MRHRWAVVPFAVLTTAAFLAVVDGCTIINGLVVATDATGPVAMTDAEAGVGTDSGCHVLPPPPPAPETIENPNVADVVVVAKEFLLSTKTGTPAFGFDLDNACSVDKSTETCIGESPHFDPAGGGIDNNAGLLFNAINDRTDLEARLNAGIRAGRNSVLIRIAKYNGKADDPSVTVSLYASPGLFDPPGSDQHKDPKFLESEAWELDRAQFNAISGADPITTTQGYVANGILVTYTSATIALSDTFSVTLSGAVLTAVLDLSGPKPTIKSGVLAGRWAASDILRVIARQRPSGDGGKDLCDLPNEYNFAKGVICNELDIMIERASDGKGLKCDATSAAIRFNAGAASLGPLRDTVPEEPCPGFPPDDCKDGG